MTAVRQFDTIVRLLCAEPFRLYYIILYFSFLRSQATHTRPETVATAACWLGTVCIIILYIYHIHARALSLLYAIICAFGNMYVMYRPWLVDVHVLRSYGGLRGIILFGSSSDTPPLIRKP